MKIRTVDADRVLGEAVHLAFSAKPGGESTPSAFALSGLSAVVTKHRPRTVFDCRAGIGAMTRLLLDHPHPTDRIVALEGDEASLRGFAKNIPADPRVRLVTNMGDLLIAGHGLDLIICDKGIDVLLPLLGISERTRFFFDSNREPERRALSTFLSSRNLRLDQRHYPRFGLRWLPRPRRVEGFWLARVAS